jgi:hypothetical protein
MGSLRWRAQPEPPSIPTVFTLPKQGQTDEAFKMGMTALSGHDNRIACITQNQAAKTKSWDRHPDPATFHWAEIGLNVARDEEEFLCKHSANSASGASF